ncbi:hypothetical protein AALO_G00212060 [Alosa alosa]|uniref:BZIP domain-containing protein n=2 Tax=Alosa TaxID=34772 RepID=A0AAV6G0N5_9TELE|nr:cAMP-responsive element modulator-like isoform X1 [Alosa sapidissima]XP_041924206.1 cAMP-responsive element modulator-like isoform X1 [Alosa sapidissima]XP_048122649.1 cAMP-responsive element modulator-like isoform X1 [Alosa alosa]XP_048122650.1 cAMP-responsive element modulator-like isoform X1 [Alosa alosa]KAG5268390.1 hypothetical protein AALO_G00212060 [Alosa alosa]
MEEASLKKSTSSKCSSLHPQGPACGSKGESQAATMVKLPNGQIMQVQRVIQTPQSTVIQSPQVQKPQLEDAHHGKDAPGSKTRRENVSRRAPYRKVNNLASDSPSVPRIEDKAEDGDNSGVPAIPLQTSIFQTSTGQYIAFTQGGAIQITNAAGEGLQGLQTLTMPPSGAPQSGPPMVPYGTQSGDGTQQYYMPGSKMMVQAATGDISAYQIRTSAPSLPQGVMMSGSSSSMHRPQQHTEEATRKRELRLLKNREAAKECRRRKREYVRCLETRLSVLEVQNKKLLEELQYLKDIYNVKSS